MFAKLEPRAVGTHWGDGNGAARAAAANRTLKDMVMKGLGRMWVPLVEALISHMHVIFSLCISSTWDEVHSLTTDLAVLQ